jgi:predicted DNA-binding protein (MmcQ/YjbR family)
MAKQTDAALKRLFAFGLTLPGAHKKAPWPGHNDLAVNDKTFAYLAAPGEPFSISCKLPTSAHIALLLPFVSPAGYGLGKSGWVSAIWPKATRIDEEMLRAWILESYRAQAPKKLVKELDARDSK